MACKVTVNSSVLDDDSSELIGSIDQGTSSSRFLVFTRRAEIVASAQVEHTQIFPAGDDKVGWHEHDPLEIWSKVKECIDSVCKAIQPTVDLVKTPLKAIGITNQRETTVAWNARTGKPYYNAIVWDDVRTAEIAERIGKEGDALPSSDTSYSGSGSGAYNSADRLRARSGLPLASYFAGTKVRWLIENVDQLQKDLQPDSSEREYVRFGTIDTWLVYQLTGADEGSTFVTDVTNASRWLLMNIHTLKWDSELIEAVCGRNDCIPLSSLPEIRASSEVYGRCSPKVGISAILNVPIASILGDQQAALFGQVGFQAGDGKCTYGTGVFLLMNTETCVPSEHGLLSTVAYKLGPTFNNQVAYALEGSVAWSGATIQWLRDQLQIISSFSESEKFASLTKSNDGLYFVPAFSGLFAPYWRPDARGCMVGLTASHTKNHICRAALEATAYQVRDLFDAIYQDSGTALKSLRVDGGGTVNELLMQFQCDLIDTTVIRPQVMETTALGAAFAAGLAVGVWSSLDQIQVLWKMDKEWKPSMDPVKREKYIRGWKKALTKSYNWVEKN